MREPADDLNKKLAFATTYQAKSRKTLPAAKPRLKHDRLLRPVIECVDGDAPPSSTFSRTLPMSNPSHIDDRERIMRWRPYHVKHPMQQYSNDTEAHIYRQSSRHHESQAGVYYDRSTLSDPYHESARPLAPKPYAPTPFGPPPVGPKPYGPTPESPPSGSAASRYHASAFRYEAKHDQCSADDSIYERKGNGAMRSQRHRRRTSSLHQPTHNRYDTMSSTYRHERLDEW